ncbi:hypothetical protein FQR65_LT15680 [Abscondita terminalis]|nr:hypothetical protein FQR65_LT15680 [Abscondita terminalis]
MVETWMEEKGWEEWNERLLHGSRQYPVEDSRVPTMTIDFYYAEGSGPCRFIQILIKHLGIEVNPIHYDLMKKEHMKPEFIKINPQHCVPTIVDNGFALWESNAIAAYLIQKYAKDDEGLCPKEPKRRAMVDQRLYFNNGTLGQRFADYYYPIMLGNATPDEAKFKKMQEAFEFLETFLDKSEYVAGDCLSVADLAIGTTVATYDVAKFDRSAYKNVDKWYKKVQKAVPAFDEYNSLELLTKLFEKFLKNK